MLPENKNKKFYEENFNIGQTLLRKAQWQAKMSNE